MFLETLCTQLVMLPKISNTAILKVWFNSLKPSRFNFLTQISLQRHFTKYITFDFIRKQEENTFNATHKYSLNKHLKYII